MRALACILFLVCLAFDARAYSNVTHSLMRFTGATPNALLDTSGLNLRAVGGTNWDYNGTSSDFESWTVITNQNFEYPTPLSVNGTLYTGTGDRAITYTHGTGNAIEYVEFITPGTIYTFSNMVVRAFFYLGATNSTVSLRNMDLIRIDGGSFCACQQQLGPSVPGGNALIAHTQTNGVSLNGSWLPVTAGQWYYIELHRDFVRQRCTLRLFDPITFKLHGESYQEMYNNAGEFGAYAALFFAHYIDLGAILTGRTTIAGPAISYSNASPALNLEMPIEALIRSNRFEWIAGTNVGVIGGIPTSFGGTINLANAPYNIRTDGGADVGAVVNAGINAASSNDVVQLPAGLFDVRSTNIVLNKDGVVLRGSGTNTIIVGAIVGGHSTSGNESFSVTNGGTSGTTNLVLDDITDAFGSTIAAGDAFEITQVENDTNETFQVIAVNNSRRNLGEVVYIHSRSGNTVSITAPLMWTYTNSPKIRSLNLTGTSSLRFKQRFGFEDFRHTTTNSGLSTSPVNLMSITSGRNFWVKGVKFEYPINYALALNGVLEYQIESNRFGLATSAGTSRSGITVSTGSRGIVWNNAFHDLTVGMQNQGGSFAGNIVVANLFVRISDKPFLLHGTHAFYNLIEQNRFGFSKPDGYFGSNSHNDEYGNRATNTTAPNKFTTHYNYVGNVYGDTNLTFIYEETSSGFTTPYPIFAVGYPHISNQQYDGTSPPRGWNNPGPYVNSLSAGGPITNFAFQFNNTYGPTNVLWTNMLTAGTWRTFTNIPSDGSNYPLIFQDANNTNKYWPDDGTQVYAASAGTASNLTLTTSITVSNNWRIWIAGAGAYNQRQATNRHTHFISDNVVYTNVSGVNVSDSRTTDRSIPKSLAFARTGFPAWWRTNRQPAINALLEPPDTPLPVDDWFNAVGGGEEGGEQSPGTIQAVTGPGASKGGPSRR